MNATKKTTKEFIQKVIVPIEQNYPESDTSNLYVLIVPPVFFEYGEDPFALANEYNKRGDSGDNMSSLFGRDDDLLPSQNTPGKWVEKDDIFSSTKFGIKLMTLSGIVWHGSKGGNLYLAEFEGEAKRLELDDFFYFYSSRSERENIDVMARTYIDDCIYLGQKVMRARLVRKVGKCTPFLLWTFAIDCIERACTLYSDAIPDSYMKGLMLARAFSNYMFGKKTDDYEELLKKFSVRTDYEMRMLISGEKDYNTKSIGEAIVAVFNSHKPFYVVQHIQTAMAWLHFGEYMNEYEYPGLGDSNLERMAISKRIWYALRKRELNWQVSHLRKLLNVW